MSRTLKALAACGLGATTVAVAAAPQAQAEYHSAGSSWKWEGGNDRTSYPTASIGFDDRVSLSGYGAGCTTAYFDGKSHISSSGADSVILSDNFTGNKFGPGGLSVSWPPGVGIGGFGLPGWVDEFHGKKGIHDYSGTDGRIKMKTGTATTLIGINHTVDGKVKVGNTAYNITSYSRGSGVC
jgi:hypothetical protein